MHTSRHFQCLRYMEAAINLLVTMDTILIAHFRISKLISNLLNFLIINYLFVLSDNIENYYWTILYHYESVINSKLTYQNNFRWHWVSSEFDGAETAIRTCHASSTEPYTGVNKMQAIKFVAVKDVLFKIGSFLKGH